MITGKGFYIWNLKDAGDPDSLAEAAHQAGIEHILIKIADGAASFNQVNAADPDALLRAVIDALEAKGIIVWGWQYIYGYNPDLEAAKAIERVKTLGLSGFVVNAESEYKNRSSQAVKYMNALRAGLPGVTLALSSYRYPSFHREFPWKEFINRVDVIMPQVYWILGRNAGAQLRKCVEEYKAYPIRPMIPTGAAFKDNMNVDKATGDYWRPSAGQVQEFMDMAVELGCPAFNFWEWNNCRKYCHELLETISAFGGSRGDAEDTEGATDCVTGAFSGDDTNESEIAAPVTITVRILKPTAEITSWLTVRVAPDIQNQAVEKILPSDRVYALEELTLRDGSIWVRIGHRQWAARRYRKTDGSLVEYLREA